LLADAGAIQTPTLMIGAERDWVVRLKAQRKFFHGLSSSVKRMHVIPNAYHAIFHEKDRQVVVDLVREFVLDRFAKPAAVSSLLNADQSGHTWREYEHLKNNGSLKFAIARVGLRTAGWLSRGVEVGWRSGFDSGLSLDYVYENKPRGAMGLGRMIDKAYLNSIGWRGIRQRKANLEKALRTLVKKVQTENRPVHIFDVAAGAGRYVIETIRALPEIPMKATLRDYKQENIDAARTLTQEFGLDNVVAQYGDAFDRAALAATEPGPTIGIVSGLYELFPSNELVLNSLRGLADTIVPGGYLIYTNQPWHPQVEFIAHVLRNREGKPWIMRRRTTAEMDQLVRTAGFEKIDMEIDQWGMFTVSVARKTCEPKLF
jgi:SAM-dependent methyltransferase